jgi:hypothetical protein
MGLGPEGEGLTERQWVRGLVPRLQGSLEAVALAGSGVSVRDGLKLPYTCEVHAYGKDGAARPRSSSYETDLLVSDTSPEGTWVPRVVIECKFGAITTHDALSYSAKATTHKHVHPYLRYGFLAGKLPSIPARLIKHGTHFDFMATWPSAAPTDPQWESFIGLVADEVRASRALQDVLSSKRPPVQRRYQLLRRQLLLS